MLIVARLRAFSPEIEPSQTEPGVSWLDASGFEHIDFDLDVTLGGTDPLVEVTPLYYGAAADAWFRGESAFFTATGRYRLRVAARGARVFLAVTALEGDTPTLDLDVWASLT